MFDITNIFVSEYNMKSVRVFPAAFLIACFLVFSAYANAPEAYIAPGKIIGHVIDSQTEAPLSGANVFIDHGIVGSATDKNGDFAIVNAPVGSYKLVASMIGYNPEYKEIDVISGQTVTIDFTLKEGLLEMGAVTVTGTAIPHVFEDVPVKTEVITREIISRTESVDLAEALQLQTGVRVENNCQNCNFTQVRILGMDGPYSQILIDGDPVVSSLAGVYGLEQFPTEMIEQVEVVKGGGSALYGGGAIAGTVNMITRKPLTNRTHIKYYGQSVGAYAGDNGFSAVAERVNEDRSSGAYIYGAARDRNPYDHNEDGYSELGQLKSQTIGVNWYYNPIQTGSLKVHAHHLHEKRRGGDQFEVPFHEANVAEAVEHLRWGGTIRWEHRPLANLDYRLYYSTALTYRDSYYGGLGDPAEYDADNDGNPDDAARLDALAAYGNSENQVHLGGVRTNISLGHHILTAGADYSSDHLQDASTRMASYHLNETYTNTGLYLQDNFHFLADESMELLVGGRFDNHSELNDPVFSPRASLKYNPVDGLVLRSGFSTGFKAPQVFDEDLHIESLGGDQRVIRNDPNLKEETSLSFNGGLEYQNYIGDAPYSFAVTGFHTILDNALALDWDGATQLPDGTYQLTRVNNPGATVSGIEVNLGYRPISPLEFRLGATFKESEYDEPEGGLTSFPRSPDVYGNLFISYTPLSVLSFYTALNYTGDAWVPHEEPTDGTGPRMEKSDSYMEMDLGLKYTIFAKSDSKFEISTGVKNIFDSFQDNLDIGPTRDPAFVYGPSLPRTIYLGVEVEF